MAYSQELISQIDSYLEKMQFNINSKKELNENDVLYMLRVKIQAKIQNLQVHIFVHNNDFSLYAISPISADENHRLAAAEYLTRVNYGLRFGNFELDMNSGDIRYRIFVPTDGEHFSEEIFRNSVIIPITMYQRFGDGLLEVLFDFKTPQEAYSAIVRPPQQTA